MALRPTPLTKFLLIVVIVVGIVAGLRYASNNGYIPSAGISQSTVPKPVNLPNSGTTATTPAVALTSFPSADPVSANGQEMVCDIWAWNAQAGLILGNGGAATTRGSLVDKHGGKLRLVRQDDTDQMKADLIAGAKAYHDKKALPQGAVHCIVIMGDGAAQFLAAANPLLKKVGAGYEAKIVASLGHSRGEDKFMGLADWKRNPQSARGGLIAGVLRDGDWNIAMSWAAANEIPNNPDETTYDPNALNWVNAKDYIDAGEKYIAGYCDPNRKVKAEGKLTGETRRVCVNGVVTWTPGDVNVAEKRGGLVSILSTAENRSQMPATMIVVNRFAQDNRAIVEGTLAGEFEAADQIKSYPQALRRASELSAQVYKEQNADYWETYFKGVTKADKQGLMVPLGGSSVDNLADNLQVFGLTPGSVNQLAATYTAFGDIVVQQYPKLVPSYPSTAEIVDSSFVSNLARTMGTAVPADMPTFAAGGQPTEIVGRRAWHINFDTGKATFTPDAERELGALLRDLVVSSGTIVEVHGHTDNVGNSDSNKQLSERRAFAVKQWLEQQSPANFPENRVRVFAHGDTNPVASNDNSAGKAKNRRVEIVLGR